MNPIRKQIYRNLLANKGYIAVLFLVVILTTFMYYFVEFSIDRNAKNLLTYVNEQQKEQFRFQVRTDMDEVQIIEGLRHDYEVEARSIKKISLDNRSYFFTNRPNEIDLPYIVAGRLPLTESEIALLPQFMQSNGLEIGQSLVLGDRSYIITGSFYLPDYEVFIPFGDIQQDDHHATFAIVTPKIYEQYIGKEERYYAGRVKDGNHFEAKIADLKNNPSFSYIATSNEINSHSQILLGLDSNRMLAHTFLVILGLISLFLYYMFYKRFMLLYKQEFGCFKALGYTKLQISAILVRFSFVISAVGALAGLVLGYIGSSVLLQMYNSSYSFPHFARGINISSFCYGVVMVIVAIVLITYGAAIQFMKQDSYTLLNNVDKAQNMSGAKIFANKVANLLPQRWRLPVRVVLRKWNTLFLSALTILIVSTLFITSYSLYMSSSTIIESQTIGRTYEYDTTYDSYQQDVENLRTTRMYYLQRDVHILQDDRKIPLAMVGLDSQGSLLELYNLKHEVIDLKDVNGVVISQGISELYGIGKGDNLELIIDREQYSTHIAEITLNGDMNTMYLEKATLAKSLGIPSNMHSGELSNELKSVLSSSVVTTTEKRAVLESNAVSNRSSAVINQLVGALIGCLLLYMVVLLNFQDRTQDMSILRLLGYKPSEINSLLVDVYRPILLILYLLILPFAINISYQIHRLISLQTNDYIPFSTNGWLLLLAFVAIMLLYSLVVFFFKRKTYRLIKKGYNTILL
ncbi:putative ABC transport system permease protein [Fontibacillus solani]|uniref:Putative ABC transport system permease protein n=1 Tax=Fontibacillus solani TaxID=1572857 RepID=A0A7W3SUJ3_9BACL|nr:ABC transporter permease [Fontibacillus solani]MBA9086439.1 putative ABC transport system permease protein [Fontibacillus solani]